MVSQPGHAGLGGRGTKVPVRCGGPGAGIPALHYSSAYSLAHSQAWLSGCGKDHRSPLHPAWTRAGGAMLNVVTPCTSPLGRGPGAGNQERGTQASGFPRPQPTRRPRTTCGGLIRGPPLGPLATWGAGHRIGPGSQVWLRTWTPLPRPPGCGEGLGAGVSEPGQPVSSTHAHPT